MKKKLLCIAVIIIVLVAAILGIRSCVVNGRVKCAACGAYKYGEVRSLKAGDLAVCDKCFKSVCDYCGLEEATEEVEGTKDRVCNDCADNVLCKTCNEWKDGMTEDMCIDCYKNIESTATPEVTETPEATETPEVIETPVPEATPVPQQEESGIKTCTFVVTKGESARQVANRLEANGIIANADEFTEILIKRGVTRCINVGTFEFTSEYTYDQIIKALTGK